MNKLEQSRFNFENEKKKFLFLVNCGLWSNGNLRYTILLPNTQYIGSGAQMILRFDNSKILKESKVDTK